MSQVIFSATVNAPEGCDRTAYHKPAPTTHAARVATSQIVVPFRFIIPFYPVGSDRRVYRAPV